MKVRNIKHRALKWFYEEANARGLPTESLSKLRDMPAFSDRMKSVEDLKALKLWKAHTLTGDRKATFPAPSAASLITSAIAWRTAMRRRRGGGGPILLNTDRPGFPS